MTHNTVQVDLYTYNNCVYPPSNLVRRVSECDMIVCRHRVPECHNDSVQIFDLYIYYHCVHMLTCICTYKA